MQKIAIVGASVSGCATALMLKRSGFDVTLFEQRAQNSMVDRGTGIMLPTSLVAKLIEEDFFDQDFPSIEINERHYFAYDQQNNREQLISSHTILISSAYWGNIYSNLIKRLPPQAIQYNKKVTAVSRADSLELTFDDKEQKKFDIVLFADGYDSLGRRFLYPAAQLEFAHYIAWRGVVDEINPEVRARFCNNIGYYGYAKGHCLIYPIPNIKSHSKPNDYIMNWLLYEKLTPDHPLVLDNKTNQNIAPTAMKDHYIEYLRDLTQKNLPPCVQDIILKTKTPFIQTIGDAIAPNYFDNNIGLLGDAAVLVRPHAGAGATKALEDALHLKSYLEQEKNIYLALTQWGQERLKNASNLYELSRALGDFLVTNIQDWQKYNKETFDQVWQQVIAGHNWYAVVKDE